MELNNELSCEIVAKPSKCIKYHHESISLDDTKLTLILVTMKRSFLVAINSASSEELIFFEKANSIPDEQNITMEDMMIGFTNSNPALKGLSLAIGDSSTCIINSSNSLASATLASRLSKKLNQGRPVYVANNYTIPHDTIDPGNFMAKLYMKIFQFTSRHYVGTNQLSETTEETKTNKT